MIFYNFSKFSNFNKIPDLDLHKNLKLNLNLRHYFINQNGLKTKQCRNRLLVDMLFHIPRRTDSGIPQRIVQHQVDSCPCKDMCLNIWSLEIRHNCQHREHCDALSPFYRSCLSQSRAYGIIWSFRGNHQHLHSILCRT